MPGPKEYPDNYDDWDVDEDVLERDEQFEEDHKDGQIDVSEKY